MKIAIGCDHHGYELKEAVKRYLLENGVEVEDFGCHSREETDYPDVAFNVAEEIRTGRMDRGILICGTGIGMAIAASKVPGVRAALCHDTYSAERSRKSNNAQILTMGAKVIGIEAAKKVVDAWMRSEFEGGNSERKVNKIMQREKEYLGGNRSEEADQSAGQCG
ncbi:MAG: ribose 5-phosphate isomerase B [Paenibacillaceae bacterium ZCTH02-B3]|mgnify:CR=1 FL=1|nr:MAG: ribose 5-phosphate isomerase B [Paenibacillaceae bacterium ZCTH02-B3]